MLLTLGVKNVKYKAVNVGDIPQHEILYEGEGYSRTRCSAVCSKRSCNYFIMIPTDICKVYGDNVVGETFNKDAAVWMEMGKNGKEYKIKLTFWFTRSGTICALKNIGSNGRGIFTECPLYPLNKWNLKN